MGQFKYTGNLFNFQTTVFPHIVAAATILFWNLECGNYSREETVQRGKLSAITEK